MGCWGIKSYENDDAHEALDRAFERVHGDAYDELMDDRSPLSLEDVQKKLANEQTLAAALDLFEDEAGSNRDLWDDLDRLGYAGIVVRHVELGVPAAAGVVASAIAFLEAEEVEWEGEATHRKLRRDKELTMLRAAPGT
ncbi:hypothetical protein [Planctomyces sp. SH-PL62]|uniref:hypothetical protein n=1 Tax=Planctomyces sp. SH-PL62 TaxID=1636152 RepID=UPI00078D4392|nr:hypothetical protein [Planctomyces sp. SH-PL62]AMV36560.1 hypothetical protein VT85_03950 [Planctomyces sp. SH-PL62]